MTATVQDVATQLGRPIDDPQETAQIGAWIELADMMIRKRYPNLDRLIAYGRINPNAVDLVEAQAVARYSRNPEGYTSRSDHIDDYQSSTTYSAVSAASGLSLTDAEWAVIAPSDSGAAGAFTIVPAGSRSYSRGGGCGAGFAHGSW